MCKAFPLCPEMQQAQVGQSRQFRFERCSQLQAWSSWYPWRRLDQTDDYWVNNEVRERPNLVSLCSPRYPSRSVHHQAKQWHCLTWHSIDKMGLHWHQIWKPGKSNNVDKLWHTWLASWEWAWVSFLLICYYNKVPEGRGAWQLYQRYRAIANSNALIVFCSIDKADQNEMQQEFGLHDGPSRTDPCFDRFAQLAQN